VNLKTIIAISLSLSLIEWNIFLDQCSRIKT